MYPRDFFETYWRTDIRNEVFVVMPFNDEFNAVWESAIKPAVEDNLLLTKRVDSTVLSGSIITDILDGIAHSKIILADISVMNEGRFAGQRNGNVMYEVGLAHAIRQTTEILLIKSDKEQINFDIAGINVHTYKKDNLSSANLLIDKLIKNLLKEIEQEKSLKVQRAIELLDADSFKYLRDFASEGSFTGPAPKTMGEELVSISNKAALSRLQQLGILAFKFQNNQTYYDLTLFGKALIKKLNLKFVP